MLKAEWSAELQMNRLPPAGVCLAPLARAEVDLTRILANLGVGKDFGRSEIAEVHLQLAKIVGGWLSEQSRLEVSSVSRAILSVAKNLDETQRSLSGLETGIHGDLEIAVAGQVAQVLALDPAIGSLAKAQETISSFCREAGRIAHACMVARADLPDQRGEPGRPSHAWYDDFTALLFDVAERAGVEPSLRKHRITGARTGWLFDAARALESFLWAEMRSPSPEACGKRLERSRRNLRDPKRRNRSRR